MKNTIFLFMTLALVFQGGFQIQAQETLNEEEVLDIFGQAESVDDIYTYIDSEQLLCTVDWKELALQDRNVEFLLIAEADGNTEDPLFTYTTGQTQASFLYPEDTRDLTIKLYNKIGTEYVLVRKKDIQILGNEYLRLADNNRGDASQVELEYYSMDQTTLNVQLNDQISYHQIQGQGSIDIALESGENNFIASFGGKDHIIYRASGELYYNTVPPTIYIYESSYLTRPDAEEVEIKGRLDNGSYLTIEDQEVSLDENGEFAYTITLDQGQNRITLFAKSQAGVSSFKSIVIDKEKQTRDRNILPIIIGIGVIALSIVVIRIIRFLKF